MVFVVVFDGFCGGFSMFFVLVGVMFGVIWVVFSMFLILGDLSFVGVF